MKPIKIQQSLNSIISDRYRTTYMFIGRKIGAIYRPKSQKSLYNRNAKVIVFLNIEQHKRCIHLESTNININSISLFTLSKVIFECGQNCIYLNNHEPEPKGTFQKLIQIEKTKYVRQKKNIFFIRHDWL
jgi:hypothetical protein